VDAVDSLGRNLSLPTDLPVEVTPIDGPRAGGKYEEVVADRLCLPCRYSVNLRIENLRKNYCNETRYWNGRNVVFCQVIILNK